MFILRGIHEIAAHGQRRCHHPRELYPVVLDAFQYEGLVHVTGTDRRSYIRVESVKKVPKSEEPK